VPSSSKNSTKKRGQGLNIESMKDKNLALQLKRQHADEGTSNRGSINLIEHLKITPKWVAREVSNN